MIGRKLKIRRMELGMTQEELAQKLGYKSKSTINKIELDRHDVSQSKIIKIAEVLKCSPLYFIDDDPDTPSPAQVEKALELYEKYKNAIPQIQEAVDSLLKSSQPPT